MFCFCAYILISKSVLDHARWSITMFDYDTLAECGGVDNCAAARVNVYPVTSYQDPPLTDL